MNAKEAKETAVPIMNKKMEEDLFKKGYKLVDINKSCKYLICNKPSNSSKYQYAVKNNIPIVTEEEFNKL
jgi:uncharacterized protein Smg (DUF494 family)